MHGKQLEEVKNEFIKEGLEEIRGKNRCENDWKKKNQWKGRTDGEKNKKNVVVYYLSESENEQAKNCGREDEETCKKCWRRNGNKEQWPEIIKSSWYKN